MPKLISRTKIAEYFGIERRSLYNFLKEYEERRIFLIRTRHPGLPEDWPVRLLKKIPKAKHRNIEIYEY